jgi:hypothetical protein
MERQARLDFFGKNFRYLGDLLRQTVALPSQFIDDDLDSKISVTDFSLDSDILFNADLLFFQAISGWFDGRVLQKLLPVAGRPLVASTWSSSPGSN